MENVIVSEEKNKPLLDEQTLAKLLEAAYVLQEHNREMRELELNLDLKREEIEAAEKAHAAPAQDSAKSRPPNPATQNDYTFTLAQIVGTQHQIQIRHLAMEQAMSLVTERLLEITRASGAAIGFADGKKVRYRAVAGAKAPKVGTEVSAEKALCLPCIRNGQVFRCADVNTEFLVDTEECRRRGIQSLLAVPIFHDGGVAGGLELYYSDQNGFTEQDIHTSQLMAGLVTEALAREEELTWKQSLANERSVMLEALEQLKPSLSALVETAPAKEAPKHPLSAVHSASYACAKCGHKMFGEEQFCGQCGAPRTGVKTGVKVEAHALPPLPDWFEEETPAAIRKPEEQAGFPHQGPQENWDHEELADSVEEQFPDLFAPEGTLKSAAAPEVATPAAELPSRPEDIDQDSKNNLPAEESSEEKKESEALALAKLTKPADWSSAANAREFLEDLAEGQPKGALARFWDARRGDIYLAVAVILVACVVRWGIWSSHSVGATTPTPAAAAAHRKAAPDADLSLFDRIMISLGLADAPEPPEDHGNPTVKVWVDQRTALYYCPGADLYGKTPKGKYTTQRDAQLDQYEPAYRKACD